MSDLGDREVLRKQIIGEVLALDSAEYHYTAALTAATTSSLCEQIKKAKGLSGLNKAVAKAKEFRNEILTSSVQERLKTWQDTKQLFED